MIGLENLPDTGPALLIFYHAAMPIDFYYVHSKALLYRNRRMKIVADRFLFKVPGESNLITPQKK
jgi:1-acyl-sn-glycerol-3-phosphate acyltransferase